MTTLAGLTPKTLARKIRYPDVRWKATFIRHNGSVITTEREASDSSTGRASNDVLAGSSQKHIASPIGTWALQLVPRKEYFDLSTSKKDAITLPGDWCLIEADHGDGIGYRPLMYGPITDIRRQRGVDARGNVITTINVYGSDFGRALARLQTIEDVTLVQETSLSDANLSFIAESFGQDIVGGPDVIIRALLDRFIFQGANGQIIDPATGKTFGMSGFEDRYISDNLLGKTIIQPINLAGTLWQTMAQYSNPVVNEMFCDFRPPFTDQGDLVNLKPALVLRQRPFFGSDWDNLVGVSVELDELTFDDMGRSDGDVQNWIRPMDDLSSSGTGKGITKYNERIGILMPESIRRFGLLRNEDPTIYAYDPSKAEPIEGIIQETTGLLAVWNHSNERLISASMQMYHRPDIRIGYRLDYVDAELDEKLQFYIEGVNHEFVYGGRSSTSVLLTRGRNVNDQSFKSKVSALEADGTIKGLSDTITRIQGAIK